MTAEQRGSSVENQQGSSESSQQSGDQGKISAQQSQTKESVAYETHRRLLDEKKQIQAKLEAFEAQERARQEEEARKRNDYESIIKSKQEEAEKWKAASLKWEETVNHARKMSAVIDALGGNLEQKWQRLIDVDAVVLHPETGEIDSNSVASVAESFRKEWPEMLRGNGSKLPPNAPMGNAAGTITHDEWKKLPAKEMRKYKPSQIIGLEN